MKPTFIQWLKSLFRAFSYMPLGFRATFFIAIGTLFFLYQWLFQSWAATIIVYSLTVFGIFYFVYWEN